MGKPLGNKQGFISSAQVDEDGIPYGARQVNGQHYITIADEGGIPASVDDSTETLQIINYEHHEIHGGSHYFVCDYDTDFQLADTIEFVITTPDTAAWSHMTLDFSSTLGASLEIYEGSSNVVDGTSVTPINNNRNSDNNILW